MMEITKHKFGNEYEMSIYELFHYSLFQVFSLRMEYSKIRVTRSLCDTQRDFLQSHCSLLLEHDPADLYYQYEAEPTSS